MRYFLVGVAEPETVSNDAVCEWLEHAVVDRGGDATAVPASYSGEIGAAGDLPPRGVFVVRREE